MPFPPIPTKAIDLLALELYRLVHHVGSRDDVPGRWDRDPELQDQYRRLAVATLGKVGAGCVILPVPIEVRVEWAAWSIGGVPQVPDVIRYSSAQHPSRESAETSGREKVGQFGITGYRIVRREHHVFAPDTGFATLTTQWCDDPEPGTAPAAP